ncbi:hypothetical protein ACSQ67_011009 [Phaseolus vulgaris]
MAYTQGFLQLRALTTPVRVLPQRDVVTTQRNHILCMAQKEDVQDGDATTLSLLSRRLALGTAFVGGAAAAAKVSSADAAAAQLSLEKAGPVAVTTSPPNNSEYPASLEDALSLNRSSFPDDFIFGTASAAYQEDVQIMKHMNLDAYRFSMSWSRIVPNGHVGINEEGVNQEGIQHYMDLIDELIAQNIEPYVTLFHWDTPQALQEEYGGFLSPRIVDDYLDYANICFKYFGDKVKNWITLNEPYTYSREGYAVGDFAPGRCSDWQDSSCLGGDSGTEPYIVTHNLLLAHAAAVELYKKIYQTSDDRKIGITLISTWFEPYSDSPADINAAQRAIDFTLGWYMQPLTTGRYPESMRTLVGKRLPEFTADERTLLAKSYDFIGLNYYTANYAADIPREDPKPESKLQPSYLTDSNVNYLTQRNGVPIGIPTASQWLYVYPKGFKNILLYLKENYEDPLIYITENGRSNDVNDETKTLEEARMDIFRIDYHYRHLYYLLSAMSEKVNVKGYFAWSLLDNFEWNTGYTSRFGLNYVDRDDGLKRYDKLSAKWFRKFLERPSDLQG